MEVTNFPLDEMGNLKTTVVQTSAEPEIRVVFNETLTYGGGLYEVTYLTSFNTSGFKYVSIMAKAEVGSFVQGATFQIYVYDNNFGVQTYMALINMETGSETFLPHWGTGTIGEYKVHSTQIDLYMHIYHSDFDGLLTILVYLTN